jgi:glycosyltransferase involved in cell wall biosynthesis
MIYYISYSRIPDYDAMSIRSSTIAKIFINCGMDVTLVGMGQSECFELRKYGELPYVSLRIKGRDLFTKLKNYFGFKKRLKTLLDRANDIEAFVLNLNTLPLNALWYLKKAAKNKRVKLFVDCCEWYSPEEFNMGRMSLSYLQNDYNVQKYVDKSMRVIAISKYLTSFFRQKKYNVANIPVVLDIDNTRHNKNTKSEKTILMYAGSVGKKDYLDVILAGLSLLSDEELAKIEFRIFGATLNELKETFDCEISDKVYGAVKCYGRVAREVVLRNLEEADFTVLMRSSTQRYAKAGFPTKVVESLASATPVICNLTSDLADYISDGYNGVVVTGEKAEDFCQTVKKAIKYSIREKDQMSKNARITAENNFDYRLYKDKILQLLRTVEDKG